MPKQCVCDVEVEQTLQDGLAGLQQQHVTGPACTSTACCTVVVCESSDRKILDPVAAVTTAKLYRSASEHMLEMKA